MYGERREDRQRQGAKSHASPGGSRQPSASLPPSNILKSNAIARQATCTHLGRDAENFGHVDGARSSDKLAGYLVLFEVGPLEVVAQLGVEVVPKAEGLPGVRPQERVSAPAGDANDTGVASFQVGQLRQFNLNWQILNGFLSITQPRITKNTQTHMQT